MANITISNGMTNVNGGAFSTTLKDMYVGDTFGLKFTIKNTGSNTIRAWGAEMVFYKSSGAEYTRVQSLFSWGELSSGKTKTVSITNLALPAFGLVKGGYSEKFSLTIYASNRSDHSTVYGTTTVTVSDQLRFIGEVHNPKITTFEIARNGNESAELLIKAKGSRSKSNSKYPEYVKFEYMTESMTNWATMSGSDAISVSSLISGVGITTPKKMAFTLGTGTSCQFRLTFYNDIGESSQSVRYVGRAFANIHLRGHKDGGVAFGMFCSDAEPMFECAYPAMLYGGVGRYKIGDKITFNNSKMRLFADVTSSAKQVIVNIPLVGIAGVNEIRVNKFYANICNQGGYFATSASVAAGTNYAALANTTSTVYIFPDLCMIAVQFERTTAFTATNNAPAICRMIDVELEVIS